MSISKKLDDEDLKNMKFIVGEHIPNGDLERVNRPIDLFNLMMKREMLSERNLDPLAQLLLDVGREDVYGKVQQMKGKQ